MHIHYSPFQLGTAEQIAEPPKQVRAERAFMAKAKAEMDKKTKDMGCTFSRADALVVSSLPNAFISPNGPDVMRSAKAVFGI